MSSSRPRDEYLKSKTKQMCARLVLVFNFENGSDRLVFMIPCVRLCLKLCDDAKLMATVLSAAAPLIFGLRRFDRISDALISLH